MLEKKNPLVSVIVPNYNYARYLPARIDSILDQTFTDFELILLDDLSTDDSLSVFDVYRTNEHVSHIVVNEKNSGTPFKQWMKGISLARGKYVWIAEADDMAEPDFLQRCVSLAERYEDFSFCYVGSLLIDSIGDLIRGKDVNKWGSREKKGESYFDGKSFAIHNLYWRNYVLNASGVLFRREYALKLEDSGFMDMRYCGDWLFWFLMSMQGGVGEIYSNLNYFRQHTAKVTVSSAVSGGGVREGFYVVQRMEQVLPALDLYKKRLRRGRFYRGIKRLSVEPERKRELFEELSRTLGGGLSDYRLERMNQILRIFNPFLLTPDRDRL